MKHVDLVFAFFVAAFAIDLFYYLFFFARLSFYKAKNLSGSNEVRVKDGPGISVVICARNEAENLLEHLPKIFDQQYKNFEVIIVNDCSIDETEDVLRAFKNKHRNCKIVMLKENDLFIGGKKFALTMGIKAAKNDIVLFTDADCIPGSEHWIEEIATSFLQGQTEIVLGYGAYRKERTFLNKLIRFDAFIIGLKSLSFALAGIPYMGVGRNLVYRKTLFFRNKGFASHQHISFGDDDLFVNEAANKNNTRIAASLDAKTISIPKKTFKDWFKQKKRHLRTSAYYKFHHQVLLGLQPASQFFFIALFIALVILNYNFGLIAGIFFARMLMQISIFHNAMKRMGEKDLLILAPLLEIILLLIYPALWFSSMMMKKNKKFW